MKSSQYCSSRTNLNQARIVPFFFTTIGFDFSALFELIRAESPRDAIDMYLGLDVHFVQVTSTN